MKKWIVRPCTGRELAELYELSYKVFKRHLKPHLAKIGKRNGNFYLVNQVLAVLEAMGPPPGDVEIIFPRKK